uniref:protein-tyrosine-phosphatase n=1 Tax=Aplanochytrium stocchinoi TaxID=215587 RepID=A0A7S3UXR1_9STRA|mmetsp:Transcript_21020/g.25522  ORF Transcript_21020/g.25522 Transcript_21020/m.25522 type:complete len:192 (+) Transcript_21020:175-750(+)
MSAKTSHNTPDAEKVDYDLEAEKLFKKLNNISDEDDSRTSRYRDLDPLYEDPTTGAVVYVGAKMAADNLKTLGKHSIRHIVNCTNRQKLTFQEVEGFQYYRFTPATWRMLGLKGDVEILGFVDEMMDFVDQALGKGENVLIHCLAGAHRAGTTGVLVLMAKMKYDSRNATKVAQKLRPVINPFGPLKVTQS